MTTILGRANRLLDSENPLDDAVSFAVSQLPPNRGRFVRSRHVKLENRGTIRVEDDSRLLAGVLTNRLGLAPRSRGRIRVSETGEFVVHDGIVRLAQSCQISVSGRLSIGGGTYINPNTMVVAREDVTIGSHCAISWNCQILDDDLHEIHQTSSRTRSSTSARIRIGDRVLICSGATILKGVEIGTGAVVGAGAVVTCDVGPNTLVAGVPAKVVAEDRSWR